MSPGDIFTQHPKSYEITDKKQNWCLLKAMDARPIIPNFQQKCTHYLQFLTLLLLSTTCPVLANSVDPDQLASSEANWSGSALFVIKYVNFYQKPGSSNLIGWKLKEGMAS